MGSTPGCPVSLRKWVVRGLVFLVLAGLAAAGVAYQRFTNPHAVRKHVLLKLALQFPGAAATVDSARLRLFGGIAVNDVRLVRRDDPDHTEFAYFPSAVIYPDKEKMLDGKMGLRKVDLPNARLHVLRNRSGRWNIAGILGPVDPHVPIPTIVFDRATVLIEDRLVCPDKPPLEINNVHLVLLNDPLSTINFKGVGTSALAGTVQINGAWQRTTDELVLSVQAERIPVGAEWLDRVRPYCPDAAGEVRVLEGTGSFRSTFEFHPGAPRPWTHDVHWQLAGGILDHARLPVALDHIDAAVRCFDGRLTVERLSARAGEARVNVQQGWARSLSADTDFGVKLTVAHLPLTHETFDRLPAALQKVHNDFAPSGPLSLDVDVRRTAGQWYKDYVARPEGMQACCNKFRYPLDHLTGVLRHVIDTARGLDDLTVDLAARAQDRPVTIKGTITGEGPASGVDVVVRGEDIPLDETVKDALQVPHQRLAEQFRPTGLADFVAYFRRDLGSEKFRNRYHIRFHDSAVRYEHFPYPLERVSGVLDILPDHWEFHDFQGNHKGCEVHTSGRSVPGPQGDRLEVEVTGRQVVLDDELAAALVNPDLKATWKVFTPSGRMSFAAHVERLPNVDPDVEVTVTPTGSTIVPAFFPYEMAGMTGTIHYKHRVVDLTGLRALHGNSVLTMERGEVRLKDGGGVYAQVFNIQGTPLVPDDDLLRALPATLKTGCEVLQLRDPVTLLTTRLVVDTNGNPASAPDIYWDGRVHFRRATMAAGVDLTQVTGTAGCRGLFKGGQVENVRGNIFLDELTVFNQPFRRLQGEFLGGVQADKDNPDVLMFPALKADVFGGEVYGPVRVDFRGPVRYSLNLTASRIKIEEFGRHNLGAGADVSGTATAALFLEGEGPEVRTLKGRGNVHVPKGRLYSLPLLLDLLKFLGLHLPDGTAFEEAHADFTVAGPRVAVKRFDLFGNAISLRGQGELNLDGTDINLDFYAVWARVMQFLPPLIKDIPPAISQGLLKIKVRGRIGDVKFTKEPVPILVEPLKGLLNAMSGRGGGG